MVNGNIVSEKLCITLFNICFDVIYVLIIIAILIIIMYAVSIWDKKKKMTILKITDVEELEYKKDKCEVVNNVCFGTYIPIFIFLCGMRSLNIIIIVALIAVMYLSCVLQLQLCEYKKALRKLQEKKKKHG